MFALNEVLVKCGQLVAKDRVIFVKFDDLRAH